jgi:hypothetical protein
MAGSRRRRYDGGLVAKPTPGLEPDPVITSVEQASPQVARSRGKPHESKESARPKTSNDKGA